MKINYDELKEYAKEFHPFGLYFVLILAALVVFALLCLSLNIRTDAF